MSFKFLSLLFLFLFSNCSKLITIDFLNRSDLALAHAISRKQIKDEVYHCLSCLLGANPGDAYKVKLCAEHQDLFKVHLINTARKMFLAKQNTKQSLSNGEKKEASRGAKRSFLSDPFMEEYEAKIARVASKSLPPLLATNLALDLDLSTRV